MRATCLLLVLLALAVPPALATNVCAEGACVEAWSAKDGSCGGAGSERNVVAADVQNSDIGQATLGAETFCVTSGQQQYRSWTFDLGSGGARVDVLWDNTQGDCRATVYADSADTSPQTRSLGCNRALPPAVPAVLP